MPYRDLFVLPEPLRLQRQRMPTDIWTVKMSADEEAKLPPPMRVAATTRPNPQRWRLPVPEKALDSGERGSKVLSGCLDRLGNRDREVSVALQDAPSTEHR